MAVVLVTLKNGGTDLELLAQATGLSEDDADVLMSVAYRIVSTDTRGVPGDFGYRLTTAARAIGIPTPDVGWAAVAAECLTQLGRQ